MVFVKVKKIVNNKKFINILNFRRLESHLGKNPANDTKDNERCQSYLLKGVKFLSKMEILFPRLSVSSEDYLEKRPGILQIQSKSLN